MPKINRAIVSVTDKRGVVDLCKCLAELGIEIISTGGTSRVLKEAGVPVREVSDYTGFPEVLDGRLKTLHPKIEGGILGRRNITTHQQEMKKLGIEPIDLVVVNLYPFEQTIAKPGTMFEEAIEQIDIGGPTMLRAAAKNYEDVTVLADPADYRRIVEELQENAGTVSPETNFEMAVKVFQITARYDSAISHYLFQQLPQHNEGFPSNLTLQFDKLESLRYGENPHQAAAVYKEIPSLSGMLTDAVKLHGKELSFNNYLDLEAALETVREFQDPACVIIKHTNPCCVAIAKTLSDAFKRAREGDPLSSFGGIIGLNRTVDVETAKVISETFFECIIAPGYDPKAFEILQAKKNIRLMELNPFTKSVNNEYDLKRIGGGLLVQIKDEKTAALRFCQVPTQRKPTDQEYKELDFAWKVVKHVKSNAIVFTKDLQVLGVGAGQTSRVDSVKIAAMKAVTPLKGAVLASDAFFPFRDGLDVAIKHGITAVVQPGGSVKDAEVIQAADEAGIAMVFTGMRHFRH